MGVVRGELVCFILILHWLQGHRGKSVSALHSLIRTKHVFFFFIQLHSEVQPKWIKELFQPTEICWLLQKHLTATQSSVDVLYSSDISPDVCAHCWLICAISQCLVGEITTMMMLLQRVVVNEPGGLGNDLSGGSWESRMKKMSYFHSSTVVKQLPEEENVHRKC